ncbi:MAG: early set domain-containing protein [Burkholderiales bacterium]
MNLLLLSSTSFCNEVRADGGAPADIGFIFFAPAAKKVNVIGDFNSWNPDGTPLRGPDAAGNWRASVPIPDNTRSIRYAYLVDGKTVVPDPAYPAVSDDFGGKDTLRMMP